ncbi:hypothetical protein NX722_20870 [Endozoicomonas gorgoniicola]|uniref:Uncharacterized protein n=1 Tax=Endozoicomonas gorgoniicola TaxID=1234144 RepID=A0ABT3N086_9GAMM|nr:hypothetical protein [Endozoicomonas gorgoniicola]MCW7555030.1 hypothetical protein [Endozoicomonas gorgoniicola]
MHQISNTAPQKSLDYIDKRSDYSETAGLYLGRLVAFTTPYLHHYLQRLHSALTGQDLQIKLPNQLQKKDEKKVAKVQLIPSEISKTDQLIRITKNREEDKKEAQATLTSIEQSYPLPDISQQKEIVQKLVRLQIPDAKIDSFSLENMAAALFYSGINSFDEAQSLNLKIIPPGPIFHTWYAFHSTTLFDGKNNEKGFDYVNLIAEEASRLSKDNIPVILIYTNNSMSKDQIETMNGLFADHSNILVISIEEDLSESAMVDKFSKQETKNVELMDLIRFCTLVDAKYVLSVAKQKSKQEGKDLFYENLSLWEDKSLTYIDIDNILIRPSTFKIAENGFCKTSHLHTKLYLIKNPKHNKLAAAEKERATRHNAHFEYLQNDQPADIENLKNKSENLYRYLVSGQGMKEYKNLKGITEFKECWSSDVNYCSSRTDLLSEENVRKIMSEKDTKDAFFTFLKTILHGRENLKKLSALDGIQQLRFMKVNHHQTWAVKRDRWLSAKPLKR